MTPHSIWTTIESRTLLMDKVVGNIRQFLDENK
jgi:lactate dehydrogenase-like 2-hydroxyacid dehydrogenase